MMSEMLQEHCYTDPGALMTQTTRQNGLKESITHFLKHYVKHSDYSSKGHQYTNNQRMMDTLVYLAYIIDNC